MKKEEKSQEEYTHYTIAWFCGVLLFFFLGGWYLSKKISIVGISTNIAGIFLLLYLLATAAYHCYRQALPYIGERRFLIFIDFFFLSLCVLFQFPSFFVLTLINIQIVLVVLSIRQEKVPPKTFFVLYLVSLILICLLLSESLPHKLISFIVLFCGEAIFLLSLWYALDNFIENDKELSKIQLLDIQQDRIVTVMDSQNKERQKEKNSNSRYKKKSNKLEQILLAQQVFTKTLQEPMQYKIYNYTMKNSDGNFSEIISSQPNNEINTKWQKEIDIVNFISQTFADVENMLPADHLPVKVNIFREDESLEKAILYASPLSSWIISQWAFYLLRSAKELSIKVKSDSEKLIFRGLVKLDIHPVEGDSTGCPECQKKVRSLYHNHKQQKLCLQCCHKGLEAEVRQNWEDNDTHNFVWLIKKWIHFYELGLVQCGISSWENYEYFVTIIFHSSGNNNE